MIQYIGNHASGQNNFKNWYILNTGITIKSVVGNKQTFNWKKVIPEPWNARLWRAVPSCVKQSLLRDMMLSSSSIRFPALLYFQCSGSVRSWIVTIAVSLKYGFNWEYITVFQKSCFVAIWLFKISRAFCITSFQFSNWSFSLSICQVICGAIIYTIRDVNKLTTAGTSIFDHSNLLLFFIIFASFLITACV